MGTPDGVSAAIGGAILKDPESLGLGGADDVVGDVEMRYSPKGNVNSFALLGLPGGQKGDAEQSGGDWTRVEKKKAKKLRKELVRTTCLLSVSIYSYPCILSLNIESPLILVSRRTLRRNSST